MYSLTKEDKFAIHCVIHDAYIPLTINPQFPMEKNLKKAEKLIFENCRVPVGVRIENFIASALEEAESYINWLKLTEERERAFMIEQGLINVRNAYKKEGDGDE